MSPNKRIVLNIVATYGRSLYALALGLLSSRWALQALGQVDYGLIGVVGGLSAFITFFNGLLASAISRFYAINAGLTTKVGCEAIGLEECRKWFNTALTIHTTIPIILICIGYPLGVWFIQNWMTIPVDRMAACIWVFRFVCVSCVIGMVNVPFYAMYGAKQYIAELTLYSMLSTTLNFVFLFYIVRHPGDWLSRYAFFTMLCGAIPQVLICFRAVRVFPECRILPKYLFNGERFRQLAAYSGWQFFGSIGALVRNQGITLLINKYFGPVINGSMAIANSVATHTDTLSAALTGAFSPVVMNLEGRGEREKMLAMACRSSKFGAILCLIFLLPLSLEIKAVLNLWLKTPPPMTDSACLVMFVIILFDQFSRGLNVSICASGKVAKFNAVIGSLYVMTIPISVFVVEVWHGGFLAVLAVLAIVKGVGICCGVSIAKSTMGFPIGFWLRDAVFPIMITVAFCLLLGIGIRYGLSSFVYLRMFASILCMEVCLIIASFSLVLNASEREYIMKQVNSKILTRLRS